MGFEFWTSGFGEVLIFMWFFYGYYWEQKYLWISVLGVKLLIRPQPWNMLQASGIYWLFEIRQVGILVGKIKVYFFLFRFFWSFNSVTAFHCYSSQSGYGPRVFVSHNKWVVNGDYRIR